MEQVFEDEGLFVGHIEKCFCSPSSIRNIQVHARGAKKNAHFFQLIQFPGRERNPFQAGVGKKWDQDLAAKDLPLFFFTKSNPINNSLLYSTSGTMNTFLGLHLQTFFPPE